MTSTEVPHSLAPPFLDQNAIEAAIKFIIGNWPHGAPMGAAKREAWIDVLCQMRVGELKAALSKRTDNSRYRPDPYVIFQIVLANRVKPKPSPEPLPRVQKSDLVTDIIRRARESIGPYKKSTPKEHIDH